jgi:hypothetical protein
MRFLIDAQLPPALCVWFAEQGHEAEHVTERLGGQTPDAEMAAYSGEQGLVLVTKKHDFALRFPSADYQLLWPRCGWRAAPVGSPWFGSHWGLPMTSDIFELWMIHLRLIRDPPDVRSESSF